MINRATSGSEPTLHISDQFVGFKISYHSSHGFTDATCQCNRTIIDRFRGILTWLWNRNYDSFTSALSDETFIVCFSAFMRTDAKSSVLKADENL